MRRFLDVVLRAPALHVWLCLAIWYPVIRMIEAHTGWDAWWLVLRLLTGGFFLVAVSVWVFIVATGLPGVSPGSTKTALLVVGLTTYIICGQAPLLCILLFGDSILTTFVRGDTGALIIPFLGAAGMILADLIAAHGLTKSERAAFGSSRSLVVTTLLFIVWPVGIWLIQPRINRLAALREAGEVLSLTGQSGVVT